MINYYRRFVPHAAQHLYHLSEALKGKPKKLEWTEGCQKSFQAIKDALATATMLSHPRPDSQIAVTADASDNAIGAVLEQRGPTGWEPLGFYSAKLQPSQRKWPPFDRELLAAHRAIRHFRHMVEGRSFTLYTDHKSLVPALSMKSEAHSARQTNQLSAIAEYTTDIRHLEGKANVVADFLSRPNQSSTATTFVTDAEVLHIAAATLSPSEASIPQKECPSTSKPIPDEKMEDLTALIAAVDGFGVNLEQMARDQTLDPDFRRLSNEARSGLSFRKVDLGRETIIVDVSNGPARPFVPFSWRRRIFDIGHRLGHPGVERTRQTVASKFVWPTMRADVSKWARECLDCQRAKVGKNTVKPIGEFKVPEKRFSHLHIDLVTMPPSNGFPYLLTIVDRFTRWPTAIPIPDITVQSVVNNFALHWISVYGIPEAVTSDRGSQFTSAVWEQLLKTWGIKSLHTTAYHPEANGMVERLHRRLKESLIALGHEERGMWFWRLPMAMLAIRTTLKPDVGASPAQLVYGEGISLPGEILGNQHLDDREMLETQRRHSANLRMEVERLQPIPTSAHREPKVHIPGNMATATHVFVRKGGVHPPLTAPYDGPYRVAERNDQNVKIFVPGRGTQVVALNRVKPTHVAADDDGEGEDDLDNAASPSPPPPGQRPGVRTRQPAPTDRRTRSSGPRQEESDVVRPPPPPRPPLQQQPPDAEPAEDAVAGPSMADNNDTLPPQNQTPNPRRVRYFSSGGPFSKRPKVDISAMVQHLQTHLPDGVASQLSSSHKSVSHGLKSGGRVAGSKTHSSEDSILQPLAQSPELYHHPNSSSRRVTFNPLISSSSESTHGEKSIKKKCHLRVWNP